MRFALFAAFLLAGCRVFSGPDAASVPVEFSILPRHGQYDLPSPQVTVEGGALLVRGAFGTPDPCYSFAGSAFADAHDLLVRVTATSRGGLCITVLGAIDYSAVVRNLAPGTYRVTVEHQSERSRSRLASVRVRIP